MNVEFLAPAGGVSTANILVSSARAPSLSEISASAQEGLQLAAELDVFALGVMAAAAFSLASIIVGFCMLINIIVHQLMNLRGEIPASVSSVQHEDVRLVILQRIAMTAPCDGEAPEGAGR